MEVGGPEATRGSPHPSQFDAGYAGGDVESVLPFDGYRLKRDRLVQTADQHIGAQTDADIGLRAGAGIFAFDGTDVRIAFSGQRIDTVRQNFQSTSTASSSARPGSRMTRAMNLQE